MEVGLSCVGLQKQRKGGEGDNQKMARPLYTKTPCSRVLQATTDFRLLQKSTAARALSHLLGHNTLALRSRQMRLSS
jgi:hypothetical protein